MMREMDPDVFDYVFNDRRRGHDYTKPSLKPEASPREVKTAPKTPKGVCRHCGKKVGRGIAFHEKACALK